MKKVQGFLNLMFCYNMIPLTNKPTWVTRYLGNAIDHIIANSVTSHCGFKKAKIKTDLSDHFPIVFTLKINETTKKPVVNLPKTALTGAVLYGVLYKRDT